MKSIDYKLKQSENIQFSTNSKHIKGSYSEQDFIELLDVFLAPGTSCLKIKNCSAGRNVISVFLDALKNFHAVGCLTLSSEQLPAYVADIFQDISLCGDIHETEVLQSFFSDSFFSDFLWIEATPELCNTAWFAHFIECLTQFRIDRHIPIVILTYEY